MTKKWLGYALIFGVGMLLMAAVYQKCYRDYDLALEHYHEVSRDGTLRVAQRIEEELQIIYRNLKVIAAVPWLRSTGVDQPDLLSEDARAIVKQVFLNLHKTAFIAELYIMPAEGAAAPLVFFGPGSTDDQAGKKVYAEQTLVSLRAQAEWFRKNYPTRDRAAKGDIPFISGQEILASDESGAGDRAKGMVLSVPYFADDGRLGGVISVVLLSHVLQGLLPDGDYAIVNAGYSYAKMSEEKGQAAMSEEWVRQGRADPGLLYSQVLPLDIRDPISQWYIWAGHSDTRFYGNHEVAAIRSYQFSCFGLIFALMAMAGGLWASMLRSLEVAREQFEGSVRAAEEGSRAKFDFLIDKVDEMGRHTRALQQMAQGMPGGDAQKAGKDSLPGRILGEVESLVNVIQDMKEMLTIGVQGSAMTNEPFNVKDVFVSVADMIRAEAQKKGLSFELEFRNSDPFPVIVGDPMAVGRILINLATNAVEYTKKGFVRIEGGFERLEGNKIVLLVDIVDSGSGIPFSQQEHLFDIEGTHPQKDGQDHQGRGMGMVITKTLLDMLGGEIEVESTEGVGSTFRVRIPFDTAY